MTKKLKQRADYLIPRIVEKFDLDLSGMTVITEAASGAYAPNAALTAAAGANVIAVAKSSRFGAAGDVIEEAREFARRIEHSNRIKFTEQLTGQDIAAADIITNSGFVRPIDAQMIAHMKSTAVIPLMWETWEFRENEIDLSACKDRGILCLGTDESVEPLAMDAYAGILGVKNLLDLGLEVYRTRIALISQNRFGQRLHGYLNRVGAECMWFSANSSDLKDDPLIAPLDQIVGWLEEIGSTVDAILLADLVSSECLIGSTGLLTIESLLRINPAICIGVLAGVVDQQELDRSGLRYAPSRLAPAHYMSAQLYDIGPRPIMELFAAGLKTGELMARARLSGASVTEAAISVLRHPLAMDFEGRLAWV